ncbi:MAG: helix-turn-helix domain-containing protein [Verrucomicrobiota bacterium]|jgi:cytoskeletal protein RodZ
MPTVAEQLHAAREAKKLTIQQVADATKIRTDHIRALEEGNFDMFSAPVYIRGFVRNYATLLKLDVPQIMAALDTELGRTEKFKEPPPLVEESKTVLDHLMYWLAKLNWRVGFVGIAAVGIVLIVVLAALAWRHHQRSNPAVNLPPAVYQSTNAGETLPLPSHR